VIVAVGESERQYSDHKTESERRDPRKSNNHDRSDNDLSIDDNGLVLDRVHTENSGLRSVDDGCTVEGSENTSVRARFETGSIST